MDNNFNGHFNNQNPQNNLGGHNNQQPMTSNYNVGQAVNYQQSNAAPQNTQSSNINYQSANGNVGQQISNPNVGNNSYQMGGNNSNPIKPKKFNMLFIIIPIVVVVAGIVAYFAFFNDKESKPVDGQSQNSGTSNETNNNDKVVGWDDYSLFIDGKEIKLPMKFSDFQALGFYEMDTYHDSILTNMCTENSNCGGTHNSNVGNIYGLFTNGTTSHIELILYNPYDEQKEWKDCYVTRVGFEISQRNNNDFIQAKIGNVKIVNNTRNAEAIIGVTKYEDIESIFGPHYQYDYTNTLTYYPDLKSDGVIGMDDLSFSRSVNLYFDNDTRILDAYDFIYYDTGNLENE